MECNRSDTNHHQRYIVEHKLGGISVAVTWMGCTVYRSLISWQFLSTITVICKKGPCKMISDLQKGTDFKGTVPAPSSNLGTYSYIIRSFPQRAREYLRAYWTFLQRNTCIGSWARTNHSWLSVGPSIHVLKGRDCVSETWPYAERVHPDPLIGESISMSSGWLVAVCFSDSKYALVEWVGLVNLVVFVYRPIRHGDLALVHGFRVRM